jgi:hypothetical protein
VSLQASVITYGIGNPLENSVLLVGREDYRPCHAATSRARALTPRGTSRYFH